MKLYRLNVSTADMGTEVSWFTNAREANKALNSAMTHEPDSGEVVIVNVPTTRRALVNWLNTHFSTDNG